MEVDVRCALNEERALARCTRRQVGCVIVRRGAIIGRGHNKGETGDCLSGQCPRGLDADYVEIAAFSDYSNCIAIHAEDAALRSVEGSVSGSFAFVTCVPCSDCSALLFAANVTVIVEDCGDGSG